jgi:hypothetical protein
MCVDERRPRVRLDLLLRGPALLDCPQPLHDLLVEGLGAILHWDRLALPGQQKGRATRATRSRRQLLCVASTTRACGLGPDEGQEQEQA